MKAYRINAIGENSNSTRRWNDVPHGTMDEVSSYVRLDLPVSVCRQGRPKDCSTSSSNPMLEGPKCRFRREARARERYQTLPWWIVSKCLTPNGRLEKRTFVPDLPNAALRQCRLKQGQMCVSGEIRKL